MRFICVRGTYLLISPPFLSSIDDFTTSEDM
jgi:hypothetical protein